MNSTIELKVTEPHHIIMGEWPKPAIIATTDFKFKSLCDWIYNTAIGCCHGCLFCYVANVSAIKQAAILKNFGVNNPDAEWGKYILVRQWDENEFLKSLKKAENTLDEKLKPEGNRAVMLSSTTDPYQVISGPDQELARQLTEQHQMIVRRALELIRDRSTLNVRILTRSPLAKTDFDLFKSFGSRLLFGMSLPTLNNTLARAYEPHAPSPSARLATLKKAKDEGLNVYVAVAPTYAECSEADLRTTLTEVAKLKPVTVFHEPINIRGENVERIRKHGESLGIPMNSSVFASTEAWEEYAIGQLRLVERIAGEVGIAPRLHLWPDKGLASNGTLSRLEDPTEHIYWLTKCWTRISEWPGEN